MISSRFLHETAATSNDWFEFKSMTSIIKVQPLRVLTPTDCGQSTLVIKHDLMEVPCFFPRNIELKAIEDFPWPTSTTCRFLGVKTLGWLVGINGLGITHLPESDGTHII